MLPAQIEIGSLAFPTAVLTMGAGLLVAIYLGSREARRLSTPAELVDDLYLYSVVASLLGSRLIYVIKDPLTYIERPARLLLASRGPLSPVGAIVAVLGVVAWIVHRRKLSVWSVTDLLTPGLLAGGAVAVLGLDLPGRPTAGSWLATHPIELYLSLAGASVSVLIWRWRTSLARPGLLTLAALVLLSPLVVGIDFFRLAEPVMGSLSALQLVAGIVGLAAYWGVQRREKSIEQDLK